MQRLLHHQQLMFQQKLSQPRSRELHRRHYYHLRQLEQLQHVVQLEHQVSQFPSLGRLEIESKVAAAAKRLLHNNFKICIKMQELLSRSKLKKTKMQEKTIVDEKTVPKRNDHAGQKLLAVKRQKAYMHL